jgi:hypothetical protein
VSRSRTDSGRPCRRAPITGKSHEAFSIGLRGNESHPLEGIASRERPVDLIRFGGYRSDLSKRTAFSRSRSGGSCKSPELRRRRVPPQGPFDRPLANGIPFLGKFFPSAPPARAPLETREEYLHNLLKIRYLFDSSCAADRRVRPAQWRYGSPGALLGYHMSDPLPLASFVLLAGFSPRQLLFLVCVVVILVLVAASREARQSFWDPTRSADGARTAAMRPHRLLLVYALGAIILGGSLISWVRDTEYWPYSPYPMFSVLAPQIDQRYTTLRLYGVTQQEPLAEFPLDRNIYLQPFDDSRLPDALGIALRENRVMPVLKDCLERYEALRRSRIHQGPAIEAIRLYRVTWSVNSQATNVNNPDHKELLAEFSESPSRTQ